MSSVRVSLQIFVAIHFASTSEGIVVGIYHCAAQSDCSLLHKGSAFSGIECYNKYCDSDCAGIQYNADSFDCYKLRQRAECWGVEHTNDNIYLYRDISRTDCPLFTLSSFPGYIIHLGYTAYTLTSTAYGECVKECVERHGCLDFVYVPKVSTCLIYDTCTSCDAPYFVSNDVTLYKLACTVDCGTPDVNVDSVVGYSSTLQGETATYHCSAGFTLIGSDTRVCGANGQWSDSAPLCVANATTSGTWSSTTITDVTSPTTSDGTSSTTSVWTSTTTSEGTSPYTDVTSPTTSDGTSSNTTDVTTPTTSDDTSSTTTNVTSPTASDGTSSTTTDVTSPTTSEGTSSTTSTWTSPTTSDGLSQYTSDGTSSTTTTTIGTSQPPVTGGGTPAQPSSAGGTPTQPPITGGMPAQSPATLTTPAQPNVSSGTPSPSPATVGSPVSGTVSQTTAHQSTYLPVTNPLSTTAEATLTSNTTAQLAATSGAPSQASSTASIKTVSSTATSVLTPQVTTSEASNSQRPATSIITSVSTVAISRPIYIWPCLCSNKTFSGKSQAEIIEELVQDTRIDKSSTLLASSKLQCMSDPRSTARNIGILGIGLLCFTGGVMLVFDFLKCFACPCCGGKKL